MRKPIRVTTENISCSKCGQSYPKNQSYQLDKHGCVKCNKKK